MCGSTARRRRLCARFGEGAYAGLFSLASVASPVWPRLTFAEACGHAGDAELWGIARPLRRDALGLLLGR